MANLDFQTSLNHGITQNPYGIRSGNQLNGGLALSITNQGVSPGLQQEGKTLCGILARCQMQGAIAELINLIHIGPLFDAGGQYLNIPGFCGLRYGVYAIAAVDEFRQRGSRTLVWGILCSCQSRYNAQQNGREMMCKMGFHACLNDVPAHVIPRIRIKGKKKVLFSMNPPHVSQRLRKALKDESDFKESPFFG